MEFKDLLNKDTYGSLLDKTIRPSLKATMVEQRHKDLTKKVPSIIPPTWPNLCSNEMWATKLDMSIDGDLSKMSLDPLLRRFYAKKEEIMTEVLGWLTAHAPDSIRPILLAALEAKRLLELIEYIKCATTILQKIQAFISKMINALINAQKSLMKFLAEQARILTLLEQELLGLPNFLLAGTLKGIMVMFTMYLNDVMAAIAASDIGQSIAAVGNLLAAAKSLKNTLKQAQAFAKTFPGAAFAQMKSFLDQAKYLVDGTLIKEAQDKFKRDFGWLAGSGPEGRAVWDSVLGASALTWPQAAASAQAYCEQQEMMAKAQPINNEVRNEVKYDLYRMTPAEMMNYNSNFAAYATPQELEVWTRFIEAPITEKQEAAKSLTKVINEVSDQNDLDIKTYNDNLAAVNTIINMCESYLSTASVMQQTQAEIDGLDEKIASLRIELDKYSKIDLMEGVQELIDAASGSFAMTLTNDGRFYESYDSVTTKDVVNQFSNWSVNQWYDLHSVSAEGTLIASEANMIALRVKHSCFDKNPNDRRSVGLRMIIDNGAWILECYNDGDPTNNEDVLGDGASTVYGRFTAVPTTPNPNTVVLITYDEWQRAKNHPNPVLVPDSDFEIVAPPTVPFANNESVYHDGNPVTGKQWERYLTQSEIDFRESVYLQALQSFKLSPISQTVIVGGRTYSMTKDHQISDLLLLKKPYTNMMIPMKAVSLQAAKIYPDKQVVQLDGTVITTVRSMPLIPSDLFPFALSASWGFVSKVL